MVLAKVCNTTITFPNKIEVKSYSFVLSLCFLAITLVTFVQICRIKYHRHSLFHYQFGFLLYCLIWSLIQFFFWFLIPWDDIIELVLAGYADWDRMALFSFLVLGWCYNFKPSLFWRYSMPKLFINRRTSGLIIKGSCSVLFSFLLLFTLETRDYSSSLG